MKEFPPSELQEGNVLPEWPVIVNQKLKVSGGTVHVVGP